MAAFDDQAFSTDAFDENAFDFGVAVSAVHLDAAIDGVGSLSAELEVVGGIPSTPPVVGGRWDDRVLPRLPERAPCHLEADLYGASQVKGRLRVIGKSSVPFASFRPGPRPFGEPIPTAKAAHLASAITGGVSGKARMTTFTEQDRADDSEVIALAMKLL